MFGETYGAAPVLGRLFQMGVEADYGTEPFTRTSEDLEAALADAAALVERCRRIVDQATAEEPNEPDPPPDQ